MNDDRPGGRLTKRWFSLEYLNGRDLSDGLVGYLSKSELRHFWCKVSWLICIVSSRRRHSCHPTDPQRELHWSEIERQVFQTYEGKRRYITQQSFRTCVMTAAALELERIQIRGHNYFFFDLVAYAQLRNFEKFF